MPGLNQLKKFSEDIREIGDEVKIRAQRGEKVPIIPLPQGISEEDDSNDFIIGLPDKNNPAGTQEDDLGSIDDIIGTGSDTSADLEDLSGMDPDIAALLNPQASADEDALADFLNDDNPASVSAPAEPLEEVEPVEEPVKEETPLEDLDLDSLLAPSENPTEETGSLDSVPKTEPSAVEDEFAAPEPETFSDLGDALSNLGDLSDSSAADSSVGETLEAPTDFTDIPSTDGLAPEPDEPSVIETAEPVSSENPPEVSDNDLPPVVDMGDIGDLGDLGDLSSFGNEDSAAPESDLNKNVSEIDLSPDALPLDEAPAAPVESASEMSEAPAMEESASSAPSDDIFSMDLDSLASGESPDQAAPASDAGGFDFNTDMLDGFGDMEAGGDIPSPEADVSDSGEIPNAFDEVPDEDIGGVDGESGEIALDTFDTSGMDDVDFGSSEPSGGDEFPATDDGLGGGDDDFVLDSSFEIPGFSDTETADMGKKKPVLDTIDFSKGKEGRPKNSLTEEEYAQFKKNLSNYPLNLRIALEDFIARDEFTDEAVFEIIEKVLKKVSARQLATQLEKILDISINIPRDFERRSFAEYEAYKQSFQYQLKNRIIPAAIVGIILAFVCFGLFKAGQHFIYEPVMANMHYKQGYALLEANEFPQSEDEFSQAVKYRAVKKWFFKYAEGYRGKKQFERAAQMYKNILRRFNHDKQAGLDYAEMELIDRANYARAEEIVRREVLDYHINDADGILMLGDVFLEWAEVEPSKYELAKEQYFDLIQRYGNGENNVYLSRMMRYNIRTDKLRDVIFYKNIFYQSKQDKQNLKNLGASDWTELSGYMLEKLYGTLNKNDEYLRSSIEDVLAMLNLAIKADPSNPVARYNLARYFIHNGNTEQAKVELERSLDLFENVIVRTKKNVYREINATRVLGELYASNREYLKAQTVYTRGINLYNEEHEASELEGDVNTGKLFADMGDLDYFISGEMDDALYNYEKAIEIKNDTPSINYRVGAIYYNRKNYDNALVSFIKVAESEPRDPNILLSLGNVLSLRGDNFAAESYYADLIKVLDQGHEKQKLLLPQSDDDDYAVVDLYLKANNNLGVTLYRLAQQTGDSGRNAEAIVRLSDSIRAYDALTRNQQTMIRMEGSNLAAQNSKYITHPYPDFEPAIYTDIPRLLAGEKGLE